MGLLAPASNHNNTLAKKKDLPSATARKVAVLLPALLYLSVVVMHDPLWVQKSTRHSRVQYQTTGADCCHESLSALATVCLRCIRPLKSPRTVILTYVQSVKIIFSPNRQINQWISNFSFFSTQKGDF